MILPRFSKDVLRYLRGTVIVAIGSTISIIGTVMNSVALFNHNYAFLPIGWAVLAIGGVIAILGSSYIFYWFIMFIQRISSQSSQPRKICPRCGGLYYPPAGYCGKCGLEFIKEAEIGQPTPQRKPTLALTVETSSFSKEEPMAPHACAVCGQPATHRVMGRWLCKKHIGTTW